MCRGRRRRAKTLDAAIKNSLIVTGNWQLATPPLPATIAHVSSGDEKTPKQTHPSQAKQDVCRFLYLLPANLCTLRAPVSQLIPAMCVCACVVNATCAIGCYGRNQDKLDNKKPMNIEHIFCCCAKREAKSSRKIAYIRRARSLTRSLTCSLRMREKKIDGAGTGGGNIDTNIAD